MTTEVVTVQIGPRTVTVVGTAALGPQGPTGPQGAQGATGPQGPPGSSGSAPVSYRHVQSTPASVWTVVHNLGYRPGGIYVEDSANSQLAPRVAHVDVNTLTLSFFANGIAVATGGEADIS